MSLLPVGFGSAADDDYEITDSLRLRQSADASLAKTFSTPTNGKIWTYSVWVKRSKASSLGHGLGHLICTAGGGAQGFFGFGWNNVDDIAFGFGGYNRRYTTGLFRDPASWYHIVLKVDTTQATEANRAILYVNGALFPWNTNTSISQNSTTQINQAVAHSIGDQTGQSYQSFDGYLTEANFIDGQALAPTDFGEYDANGTWKAKEYTGTYGTNGFYLPMKPTTQAELQNTVLYTGTGASQSIDGCGYAPDLVWLKSRNAAYSNALFDSIRGTSKWLTSNGTNAEATVSGVTSFDTDGFTLGADTGQNNSGTTYAAWTWDAGDNQSSTGHSSVLYSGTAAPQSIKGFGFSPDLIIFKDRSTSSPLLIDSVRGAYKESQPNSTGAETSNNGTRIASIDADGFSLANTSVGGLNGSGKNYVAWGWDAGDGDPVSNTIGSINSTVKANPDKGFSIVSYEGTNGASDTIGHGLSSAPEMVIVKDRDSSNFWSVYHAGTDATAPEDYLMRLNTADAKLNGSVYWNDTAPTSSVFTVGTSSSVNAASSYMAYCFHSVTGYSDFGSYTGTGATGKVITTGFRPGFVMIKATSVASQSWHIYDGSRNPFNPVTLRLHTNSSAAEDALRPLGDFTDTGFTINSTQAQLNQNGATYIYMAFKGSYSDHVSPLNDDGSIDSRVKANSDKGFSIVSYEGSGSNGTIGHGLSSAPEFFFLKNRDTSVNDWIVYDSDVGATKFLRLNQTNATTTQSNIFNNTAPTNSVLSVGTNSAVNSSSVNYIAYCFHSVTGYSKFSSYTGTGSSGKVVTTGFRPAFVMIKRTDAGSRNWIMMDSIRDPGSVIDMPLYANLTNTEVLTTTNTMTFDANSFTLTGSGADTNTNGGTYIYMAFADTADARFNFDASGNKNNWLPNNINSNGESETTYDLMKDTPSLVDENAGNFATLNPLDKYSSAVIAEGNLKIGANNNSWTNQARSTFFVSSGKWYWEVTNDPGTGGFWKAGIRDAAAALTGNTTSSTGYEYYAYNGNKQATGVNSSYGSGLVHDDVLGLALDMDAGTITAYKNGSSLGVMFSGLSGSYSPTISMYNSIVSINFGQRPFKYTPPTGFLKLNTFNLPDSTIEKGSDHFNTVLYTGNATTDTAITGVGFQPDFVWLKDRTNAERHILFDAVRGASKVLSSSNAAAEDNRSDFWKTLDSDGFTLGYNDPTNRSGDAFVAWNWKANGSGVTDNSGTLNATVSANTTSGFSIVKYTGAGGGANTFAHGLGVAPEVVITKTIDGSPAYNWNTYHVGLDATAPQDYFIALNSTAARLYYTAANLWNRTKPSSTLVSVNSVATAGGVGEQMLAYCFAPVEGYSSFGSYTGNGSADGPFVYTGFKPAFVITKRTNSTSQWTMVDTSRSPQNVNDNILYANLVNAEVANETIDFDLLSNGFKLRSGSAGNNNTSGSSYIYMAFAENPFKNALAR